MLCYNFTEIFHLERFSGPKKGRLFTVDKPSARLLAGCLGLLWQKNGLDVRQNTTLCDGYTRQQFVQLLVVADGKLEMTWDDSCLLVVSGCVACKFEHFSCQVLQHSCQVHGSSGTYSLGVVALAQKTVNSAHWELKSCP